VKNSHSLEGVRFLIMRKSDTEFNEERLQCETHGGVEALITIESGLVSPYIAYNTERCG